MCFNMVLFLNMVKHLDCLVTKGALAASEPLRICTTRTFVLES